MKILFCTDGSKISYGALKNLSNWIKDAEVDIICVIDWSFLPGEINVDEINFSTSCANVADTILDYAKHLAEQAGFKCGVTIKHCGSAIESILEQAELKKYDLILMGSNGKRGLQKWLGSVSQEIINNSKISDYISKNINKSKKLLLTTDGTLCSSEILKSILPDMKLEDKQVHICMVNEDPRMLFLEGNLDQNWILDIQKQQQIYSYNAIKNIKNILADFGINVTKDVILNGNPSEEIIKYSKDNDIDLILLGSRNKSRLDRFLTGSESKRILENSMSDIWLVRCKN